MMVMVLPKNRSRSFKRIQRRTPKHRNVVHYKRRKKLFSYCAVCKEKLKGVAQQGSASEKRVERIFGGHLCHGCTEKVIRHRVRIISGKETMDDVEMRLRRYVAPATAEKGNTL